MKNLKIDRKINDNEITVTVSSELVLNYFEDDIEWTDTLKSWKNIDDVVLTLSLNTENEEVYFDLEDFNPDHNYQLQYQEDNYDGVVEWLSKHGYEV